MAPLRGSSLNSAATVPQISERVLASRGRAQQHVGMEVPKWLWGGPETGTETRAEARVSYREAREIRTVPHGGSEGVDAVEDDQACDV